MNPDHFPKNNFEKNSEFFYGTQKYSPLRALKTKISF